MLRRHVPNILSLFRIPLLLCFFQQDPPIRFLAVALASITDVLDGFLARRWNSRSRIGTVLDPITDKIFVFGVLAVFFYEGKITTLDVIALLSRDIALALFTGYLLFTKQWVQYKIESFLCGKIMTALQFLTFALLSLNITLSWHLFAIMAIFGCLSFVELLTREQRLC